MEFILGEVTFEFEWREIHVLTTEDTKDSKVCRTTQRDNFHQIFLYALRVLCPAVAGLRLRVYCFLHIAVMSHVVNVQHFDHFTNRGYFKKWMPSHNFQFFVLQPCNPCN